MSHSVYCTQYAQLCKQLRSVHLPHSPFSAMETSKLFSHHLSAPLYSGASSWLPPLLQATRTALFPNNALAPARIPPSTADEVARIRHDCAAAIVNSIPSSMWQRFFATKDAERAREEVEGDDLLGLLEDGFVNRHLIVSMVDLIVVRLFPELIEEEG